MRLGDRDPEVIAGKQVSENRHQGLLRAAHCKLLILLNGKLRRAQVQTDGFAEMQQINRAASSVRLGAKVTTGENRSSRWTFGECGRARFLIRPALPFAIKAVLHVGKKGFIAERTSGISATAKLVFFRFVGGSRIY